MSTRRLVWRIVMPYELHTWKPDELAYLELVTETIRATEREIGAAPRPIGMYEANVRTAAQHAVNGRYLDLLVRGAYADYVRQPRAWIHWAVRQLTEGARLSPRRPQPIVVLELGQDPASPAQAVYDSVAAKVHHDVALSLLLGAKGILVWTLRQRPNSELTYPLYVRAYLDAARRLNGPDSLGLTIAQGQTLPGCQDQREGQPDVNFRALGRRFTERAVTSACYRRGPTTVLVAVNSAPRTVTARFSSLPGHSASPVWATGTTIQSAGPELLVQMAPYGVLVLPLTP
jgi:hypothetical protein